MALSVGFAQIINALFAPVLGRLFTPAQFGIFSIYFQTEQLLGVSLSLRYEQAIALQTRRRRAQAALILSFGTTIVVSLPLILAAFIIPVFAEKPGPEQLGLAWPVAVVNGLLLSFFASITVYAINRNREYAPGTARILRSILAGAVPAIAAYLWTADVWFLIWGELLGSLAAILVPAVFLGERQVSLRDLLPSRRYLKYLLKLAYRHKAQPLWNLPQSFINSANGLVLTMLVVQMQSVSAAGVYFVMRRLTMLPAGLFATTMAQAYLREAVLERQKTGRFTKAYLRVLKTQLALGAVFGLVLFVAGPDLFSLFLGRQWRIAGELSRIYAPYLILQLPMVAISPTPNISDKQKPMLLVAVTQNAIFLLAFIAGSLATGTLEGALTAAVWCSVPYLTWVLWWYWCQAKGQTS